MKPDRGVQICITNYIDIGVAGIRQEKKEFTVRDGSKDYKLRIGALGQTGHHGDGEVIIYFELEPERRRHGRDYVHIGWFRRDVELRARSEGVSYGSPIGARDVRIAELPVRRKPHTAFFLINKKREMDSNHVAGFDVEVTRL